MRSRSSQVDDTKHAPHQMMTLSTLPMMRMWQKMTGGKHERHSMGQNGPVESIFLV